MSCPIFFATLSYALSWPLSCPVVASVFLVPEKIFKFLFIFIAMVTSRSSPSGDRPVSPWKFDIDPSKIALVCFVVLSNQDGSLIDLPRFVQV